MTPTTPEARARAAEEAAARERERAAPAMAPEQFAALGGGTIAVTEALSYVPNMIGDSLSTSATGIGIRVQTREPIHDNQHVLPKSRFEFIPVQHFETDGGEVDRMHFGLEKAFCCDQFSVEVRSAYNFFGLDAEGMDDTEWGNLATNFKALLHRDDNCAVSAGVGFQWVMGETPDGYPRDNHRVGPFVGFLYEDPCETYYIHGFEQLDIPWVTDDQSQLFSSVGVGYWLYKDPSGCHYNITRFAATAELHLYTPLGDEPGGDLDGLIYNDVLNMTLGGTVTMCNSVTIAFGFAFPVTDEEDFDWEFQIQINWFFGGLSAGAGATRTSGVQ